MSIDLLNRIGIACTAVAGILIAPELIGRERIQKLQSWLGTVLRLMNTLSEQASLRSKRATKQIFRLAIKYWYFAVGGVLGGVAFVVFVWSLVIALVVFVLIVLLLVILTAILVRWTAKWFAFLLDHEGLQSLMVIVGITLYIVGNSLQFGATFAGR